MLHVTEGKATGDESPCLLGLHVLYDACLQLEGIRELLQAIVGIAAHIMVHQGPFLDEPQENWRGLLELPQPFGVELQFCIGVTGAEQESLPILLLFLQLLLALLVSYAQGE